MDITKFVNKKKNILPARPKPPTIDQIMHDLKNTSEDDTAFKFLKQDKIVDENPNMNDPDQVYQIVKSYLETNKKLSELEDRIVTDETKLYNDMKDMRKLTGDFKKQAHAALLR